MPGKCSQSYTIIQQSLPGKVIPECTDVLFPLSLLVSSVTNVLLLTELISGSCILRISLFSFPVCSFLIGVSSQASSLHSIVFHPSVGHSNPYNSNATR